MREQPFYFVLLLIVIFVNIFNNFDVRSFYLGLKWSGTQITPKKWAFCYNTIWPHLMYPIGRAVFVTMNTLFLVIILIRYTLRTILFINGLIIGQRSWFFFSLYINICISFPTQRREISPWHFTIYCSAT